MRGKKARELRKKVGVTSKKDNYLFLPYEKVLKDANNKPILDDKGKEIKYFNYTIQNTGKRVEYKKLKKEMKKCY